MDDRAAVQSDGKNWGKSFLFGCTAGFAGALAAGLVHMAAHAYGITGMLSYLLDILAALGIVCLVFWMLYRSPSAAERQKFTEPISESSRNVLETQGKMDFVYSPLKGQVVSIEEVPDDTFAAKVLGEGMAVIPVEGKVYAPFEGTVDMVYDAGHAISLRSLDGIELLIHIGINTVETDGRFYRIHVVKGDTIRTGEVLVEFDRKGIKAAGYSLVSPVILTNSDDFDMIPFAGHGMVDHRDILMRIMPRDRLQQ